VVGAIVVLRRSTKLLAHERSDDGRLEQTYGLLVPDENSELLHDRRAANFVYRWQISFRVPLGLGVRAKLQPFSYRKLYRIN